MWESVEAKGECQIPWGWLCVCTRVCGVFVTRGSLWRPEESVRSPEVGFPGSCELSRGCWELNSRPVEEQQVLFTMGSSLQLQEWLSLENTIPRRFLHHTVCIESLSYLLFWTKLKSSHFQVAGRG